MSQIALHEPAILHLIFLELTQLDLLRFESVCRAWRTTITSYNDLLTILYLRPIPATIVNYGGSVYRIYRDHHYGPNPLLRRAFPLFFDYHTHQNWFASGGSNVGPWISLITSNGKLDLKRLQRFMRPEASWRKMVPYHKEILALDVQFKYPDKRAHMNFEPATLETDKTEYPSSHPPWLTFGLIYDLCEAAWFQGKPYHVKSLHLEIPGSQPRTVIRCGLGRSLVLSRRITVTFEIEQRTTSEQRKGRLIGFCYESVKRLVGYGQDVAHPEMQGVKSEIFTNEFHFDDGLSFDEIDWDEILEGPPADLRLTNRN